MGKEVVVYRGGGLKVDVRSNGLSKECIQSIQEQLLLINKRKALSNHINKSDDETVVKDYRYEGNSIVMPRYFAKALRKTLIRHGYTPVLRDYTSSVPVRWPKLKSKYKLRTVQQQAVDSFDKKGGVCSAPTGVGKCLIGLYLASMLGQKTLVIINTLGVIKSWVDDAAKFFGIPKESIGLIQANNASIGHILTIASVQTMATRDLKNLKDQFGFVIIDECHHQSASTFIDAVLKINAKYRMGLSATPRREDGLDAMIFRHLGSLYYRTSDTEGTVPVEFALKDYQIDYDEGDYEFFRYHDFCEAAMHDVERNEIICDLVMKGVEKGSKVLCTSVRKDHVILLRKMLKAKGLSRSVALLGGGKHSVDKVVDGFLDDRLDVVVATTKIILEGVNCPPWDLLIIGLPFKSGVQVEQLVGRIRRSYKDKEKAMIVDIIDTNIGSIKRQGMSRVGMYYHLGFRKVKLKK